MPLRPASLSHSHQAIAGRCLSSSLSSSLRFILCIAFMYTYAFLADVPSELPEGILGSLQIVSADGLAALVEPDLAPESLQHNDKQLVQAVLSHDRVIRELFEQTTVLPLRFGTYFKTQQGLVEHLQTNSAEYLARLEELQDKAEYSLKLTPIAFVEPAIDEAVKGKDYFLAKKQIYQAQAAWQTEQKAELEGLIEAIARYSLWGRGDGEHGVERIYLLSDRQLEAELLEQVQIWQGRSERWELSLGEALPPYHFV
jgi:Gas vesicle synthesis protein GvpL/GvpF